MTTSTNINVLLLIVYICITVHQTCSFRILSRRSTDEPLVEPYFVGDTLLPEDNYGPMTNLHTVQNYPLSAKRRIDSAEKYFDWAGKTNRPMEYLRGKRFWLFTKKDGNEFNLERSRMATTPLNSLSHGIWRSGIVGRRRR